MKIDIRVGHRDFDLSERADWLRRHSGSCGALVTFSGMVRDWAETGGLSSLFIEHYPGMTEQALLDVANTCARQWDVEAISIVHRVGSLPVNEQIVFVGVMSAHRYEAFMCAQQLMDFLKRDAPFWKKEVAADCEYWVEQKQSDLDAAERWASTSD